MILESAVLCLAFNIYHEARDQSLTGQHAVAQVTLNRAKWKNENVCKVVTARKQFSWTNTLIAKRGNKPAIKPAGFPKEWKAWRIAYDVAEANIKRTAPMVIGRNVDHYHTTEVSPSWSRSFVRVAYIGDHIFYKQS